MAFNWRRLRDTTQEHNDNKQWRAELTALVLEDEKMREDGRRICQNNLLALCWVLGYCLVDEAIHHDAIEFFLKKEPGTGFEEWCKSHSQSDRSGSLLLPRGVYKTTISLANCVQLIICWPLTIAIMIMCGRRDLAWDFVEQVGGFFTLRKNRPPTLFQALFPDLCIPQKQQATGEFTAARRQNEPAIIEPAIWGESVESGISGYHPNVLISDDLSNNRNSQTYEQRIGTTKKYKLNRKVLLPYGLNFRVGTIYGTGDIFTDEVLTSRPGSIRRVVKPAMRLKNGERLDQNGFPEEEDVELYFPAILNYDYLRTEYESGFDSFMTQYQLDEYGAAEVVFAQDQMLGAMVNEVSMPLEGRTFIHWRFPCMRKQWRTAAAAVGIESRNRCYITEAIEGQYKPSVLARKVVELARKYSVHHISVEDSPGAILMQSAIQNYALTTGWDVGIDWKEFDDDTGERDLRIRNLEAMLATGRIYFNADMKQLRSLMLEFTQYSMLPNDAIPDCVARVADNLPQSIAAEEMDDEDAAWDAARERDHYNLLYGRGQYARPEPEPEQQQEEVVEDSANATHNELGLENILGGLNG